MKRRAFVTLLGGAAAWPLAAWAQQPTTSPPWVAFEQRMGELGYQEGKNFSFELRAQMSTKPDAGPGPPPSPLLHHVGGRARDLLQTPMHGPAQQVGRPAPAATRLDQCPLRSESDRSAALPQSVAMCQERS